MALVLVTGASGFVGSHLCEELARQGHNLRLLMRRTSSTSNLSFIKDYEVALGDLQDRASLDSAVQGVDYIFHLGGLVSTIQEKNFFSVNEEGTANLAMAAQANCSGLKRFVYVSSLAAGGPSKEGSPLVEEEVPHPISSYGKSKLGGEKALEKYAPTLPSVIVRPPIVYGPRDKAFLFIVQLLKKGKELSLGRAKSNSYSFVHVKDLVQLMLLAAFCEKDLSPGEVFYASGDGVFAWKEATSFLQKALGKEQSSMRTLLIPVPIVRLLGYTLSILEHVTKKKMFINRDRVREVIQKHWSCSNEKAKNVLGFSPNWTLEKGFFDVVDWYDHHGWL